MQAQILNLLKRLQHELGVSFLFIAHGMAVVKHISDRAAVMYLGKIVEIADSKELFENCRHPYTQALISSVPDANPHFQRERIILEGEVPNPIDPLPAAGSTPDAAAAWSAASTRSPNSGT